MPFLFRFDFTDAQGTVVMSSERKAKIRDHYTITVPDECLDFRVAPSMAVAIDALQSRLPRLARRSPGSSGTRNAREISDLEGV